MVAKDIFTQSIGNLQANFRSLGGRGQASQAGDFSKTMSDVQKNQARPSDSSGKDRADGAASKDMKQLSNSKKPEMKDAKNAVDKKKLEELGTENNALSSQEVTPEQIEQLEKEISQLTTEILGITEEELMDLLEQSGLQLLDLLNPENMKQLVLEANGLEDAISLVANEDLANQYQQLVEAMEGLETESDLGITKEEVAKLLEGAKNANSSQNKEVATEADGKTQPENMEGEAVKVVVEKEADSNTGENSFKEGNFQRDGRLEDTGKESISDAKPLDVFVQNLASQGSEGLQGTTEHLQTVKEIVNQIVEQIKIAIKPESTSMEIQLNPESLGRVNLTVVSKDGLLTASFTAENQIAKEAIESQMQVLKDSLNEQGLKVEAIEVNVSQFGFRQNTESGTDAREQAKQQKKAGGRRINLDYLDEEEETFSEEEALATQVLRDNGGTVDFTA